MASISKPVAFLSYAAVDNIGGYLDEFRAHLSRELQIQTGEQLEIFQDNELRTGDFWPQKLQEKLDESSFLIAIVSPSYLKSKSCRKELETILERERNQHQQGLIFPIYYVDTPALTSASLQAKDSLSAELARRQYVDWRSLRFEPLNSPKVGRALAQIASQIRDRLANYDFASNSSHAEVVPFEDHWTVENLSLKNFRCFDSLELSFHHQSTLEGRWTCIAGINGAGKSSILQSICIGLLGEQAKELGGTLLSRMLRVKESSDVRAEIAISVRSQSSIEPRIVSAQIDSKGLLPAPSVRAISSTVLVVGYGATRNLGSEQDSPLKNMSPEVQRISSLFYPLAQLASADVLISDRRRGPGLASFFSSLVQQVFDYELAVVASSNTFRFEVMGTDRVDAFDLPDGFRSSAAWLADLCVAWCEKYPEKVSSATPSDIEAIVLIDEIDLHLHPSLQRSLVPRLRRALPKVQWIVTTHSPLILANFDANEIIALDRTQEGHVRKVDRQILNFTSDEIYDWLMGVRPTGVAMEEELQKADQGDGKSSEEIAKLMRISPQTSEETAEKQVAEFKGILKALKPQT